MAATPYKNHLSMEKSPYLMQHADNPVDWYPWGEEAFEQAKVENKPLFLSIGYSTCHWCHVMERESFADPAVADVLNRVFICVKVDREERPDIDYLYMSFAQAMMGTGAGWPLTLFLTQEAKPFFAATYLPPDSDHGAMGLVALAEQILSVWQTPQQKQLFDRAEQITQMMQQRMVVHKHKLPGHGVLKKAANQLLDICDPTYGGLEGNPKFPIPYLGGFLLRRFYETRDKRYLFLVERTLERMAEGGIYDHLGGGFARYAVDSAWQVPHFEKMAADNALIAEAYLEGWQMTHRAFYRQIVQETLDYLLRELRDSAGGFCSAQDAETEGKEGHFYLWTQEEIHQHLTADDAALFCRAYGVTPEGNFEQKNILHMPIPLYDIASEFNMAEEELYERLLPIRQKLLAKRNQRIRPECDQKVVCASNGLVIHTLALTAAAFNTEHYRQAAEETACFIRDHLSDGVQLYRRFCGGEVRHPAVLEDYAFLIRGLITLYESGGDGVWLVWAQQLNDHVLETFKAPEGAFYQTDGSDKLLLLKQCQFSDGGEPSGNSVQMENLLRLHAHTGEASYKKAAEDVARAVEARVETVAAAYTYHLHVMEKLFDSSALILRFSCPEGEERYRLQKALYRSFLPHKTVTWDKAEGDQVTLSICQGTSCYPLVSGIDEVEKSLRSLGN